MLMIDAPLPFFSDLNGSPLDSGYIYIGTSGANPETSPISVYWDSALTQPAAQPLRTSNGNIVRPGGTRAMVYASATGYSITVRDKSRQLVAYNLAVTGLAGSDGSSQVGFIASGTGAVARTVQDKLRDTVSMADFGAVGYDTSTTARDKNLNALIKAIASLPTNLDSSFYSPGGRILVPAYYYMPSGAVNIERTIELEGAAGFYYQPFGFSFPADSHGFIVQRYNTGSSGKGGDGTVFRGLRISQESGGSVGNGHGVRLKARAYLENCTIDGFNGHGFYIKASAGAGGDSEGNANCFGIRNVRIESCGQDGAHVEGNDANAGSIMLLDSSSNGGTGVYDTSFLGNSYVGCHTAANTTRSYYISNPSGRCSLVMCYQEGGQPTAQVDSPAMVIGGTWGGSDPTGDAPFLDSGSGYLRIKNAAVAPFKGINFASTTPTSDGSTLDRYAEGNWTPTVAGITLVGAPTYQGRYTVIGNTVYFTVELSAATSTANAAAGTTTITTPPGYSPLERDTAMVVDTTLNNLGIGLIDTASGGLIKPPAWTARAATIVISGQYRIAST